MSRAAPADTLPPTARAIALLLASTPSVHDAQPGVLHQLLEFAHRYTTQALSDAQVYADHAGRTGKIEMEDVVLAVQARVGWEFGGRVPKEYIVSLATQTNSVPLPPVPEVFGVRLPPSTETLTSVDFDLVPHKPPPGTTLYDEEIEEIEESESEDEDEDMEPAPIPGPTHSTTQPQADVSMGPVSAMQMPVTARPAGEDGSEGGEDEDGLFAGGDDEEEEEEEESGPEESMEEPKGGDAANGVKRKWVEDDDYD